jgi:hypothetical protein
MAPVGQVSMQPPHISHVVSSRESPSAVAMVVSEPRPASVMALTDSTSAQ